MRQSKIKTTRTSSSNKQFHIFFYKNFMCFLGLHSNGFWWIEVGNTCVAPIICNTKMDEILYQPSYWHLGYLCYKCVFFLLLCLLEKFASDDDSPKEKDVYPIRHFFWWRPHSNFSPSFQARKAFICFYDAAILDFNSARFSQLQPSRGISRNTSGQGWKPWGDRVAFLPRDGPWKAIIFCWKKLSLDDEGWIFTYFVWNANLQLRKRKPQGDFRTLLEIGGWSFMKGRVLNHFFAAAPGMLWRRDMEPFDNSHA